MKNSFQTYPHLASAEQPLHTTAEKYKVLIQQSPSAFFVIQPNGDIVETNVAATKMFGYSVTEFKTLAWLQIIEHKQKLITAALKQPKKNGQIIFEAIGIKKNGERFLVEIFSVMFTDADGQLKSSALVTDIKESTFRLRQQQITNAVINGQEKERVEIGQELHDNINQILATAKLYLECALAQKDFRRKLITESKLMTEKAMLEIRILSNALLPPSLEEMGLLEALNDLVENIVLVKPLQLITNWNGFSELLLDKKLKLTIFRIVQEQVNNIIKHAAATKAIISIEKKEGKIYLTIEDDGIGFDTTQKRSGVGLKNIISRSEVNNGKVSIQSKPGEGCVINVCFSIG